MNPRSKNNIIEIFNAAIDAVHPSRLIKKYLSLNNGNVLTVHQQSFHLKNNSNIYVLGAGKAAAAMAKEVENILRDKIAGGIVVTKYGHSINTHKIRVYEGGHPVPDQNGIKATDDLLALTKKIQKDDIVIFLLSGGASSLLIDVPENCSLTDLQNTFDLLLKSGATIEEMNTIRKLLSQIKGGGLAKKIHPATLITLIISDVLNDPLGTIGSGPTVPNHSRFEDAISLIKKYKLSKKLPVQIMQHIIKGAKKDRGLNDENRQEYFENTYNFIIGNNDLALFAAQEKAMLMGYETTLKKSALKGEARDAAKKIAEEVIAEKSQKPTCFLYGGETTVTIKGHGKGGRNQELALALGIHLKNNPDITILSAGSDGTDGPTDAAGALVNKEIMMLADKLDMNAEEFLNKNDSYNFFAPLGALFKTGPTYTNVMDIVIVFNERGILSD